MEFEAGSVIDGRYRVLSRLGAGGMADVYLAEDQQLGRKVALKLLHRRFSEDPGFVERFRREAQAAASLQHPCVVQVYDRGAVDGTYYIAMEYLEGRSLKQLIRREAPLEPLRAIDITLQILKAARFAHRRGVIHRDLKPHNVIIDDNDNAKVTDFGIARAGASDMTETGSIMGTAQYLSPEQAQGHAVSETSDLYSIGVVLYEMLTGRVPFDAESAVTIALKHVSEAPIPPRQINPSVPESLEQAVLWALNKNPADRPANADEFIRVLEQVREAIASGHPGQATASLPVVSALAAAAGGGAIAAGAPPTAVMPSAGSAAAADIVAVRPNGGEPLPGPPLDDHGNGAWPWLVLLLVLLLLAGGGVAAYLLTRPAKVTMPTVVGESLSIAQAQVQSDGLTPNVLYETSTHPARQVIGQSPLGGARIDRGSTVTLTVSSGPGNISVPSVAQLSRQQAEHQLRRSGLKISRVLGESSTTVPKGQATRTDPGSGTSVPVGSPVTLYISTGKPPIPVPNVVGDTEAAAKAALSGFNVTTTNQPSSSAQPGTVLSQSPSGGNAAPGSNVALVIASAPTTTQVPNVVGFREADAAKALTAAGFKVVRQHRDVTQQSEDGNVISQSPAGGGMAKKGATVTIVVGHYKPPTGTTTIPGPPTTTNPAAPPG